MLLKYLKMVEEYQKGCLWGYELLKAEKINDNEYLIVIKLDMDDDMIINLTCKDGKMYNDNGDDILELDNEGL